jgi:hypothetical protein
MHVDHFQGRHFIGKKNPCGNANNIAKGLGWGGYKGRGNNNIYIYPPWVSRSICPLMKLSEPSGVTLSRLEPRGAYEAIRGIWRHLEPSEPSGKTIDDLRLTNTYTEYAYTHLPRIYRYILVYIYNNNYLLSPPLQIGKKWDWAILMYGNGRYGYYKDSSFLSPGPVSGAIWIGDI